MHKFYVHSIFWIPLLCSSPVWGADSFYSGQVGTDVWMAETKGAGEETEPSNVPSLFIAFEHQFPVLPNLAFHYTNLVEDDVAYDRYSYLFYYHALDTDLYRLDTGINVSRFKDGKYIGVNQQTYHFNATTVTFHAYAQVAIPYTLLDAFAETDIAHLGGDNLRYRDTSLGVQWQTPINMGTLVLRAGYREAKVELNDSDIPSVLSDPESIKSSGWYVGVRVVF